MTATQPMPAAPAHPPWRGVRFAPWARDLLIGGAVVVGLWLTVDPGPQGRGWQLALAGLCLAAVAARGRLPVAATTVAALSTLAAWALGLTADPCVMVGLCLFALAERRGTRVFPWWLMTAAAALGAALLAVGGDHLHSHVRDVILAVIVLGAAWALGTRTQQARREAAARARAEERLRLARDVHDVLSHSLGTIGVQAGVAAHVAGRDPEQLRADLRDIEVTARASLTELRELLRRERDELAGSSDPHRAPDARNAADAQDAPNTPGAPLSQVIDALARDLERAGIRADLDVSETAEALPVAHQVTIARVAREAVTNVIRHAGATTCWIAIGLRNGAVRVTVRDDGRGAGGATEGHGLLGLRERAALLGGGLAVSDGEGGFEVTVELPVADGDRP